MSAAIGLVSLMVLMLGIVAMVAEWAMPPRGDATSAQVLGKQLKGGGPNQRFSISGSIDGLHPGRTRDLALQISNPHNFAIYVTSVKVAAGPARAGCAGTNLVATPFTGRREVKKRSTASVTLSVRMIDDAGPACAGATFPLTYTGTAVKK